MERFGFVGLPNAGKSSLYNALSGASVLAAPYAFATKDPNVGVAQVFDERLDRLAAMSNSRNVVPASVQFVDIGGLVEGASTGEGLGNKFLGTIREVEAIVFVLRAFADEDVPGPADPLEHLRVVEIELALADLETVERQLERRRKAAKQDRALADEVAALDAAHAGLAEGRPIYRSGLTREGARPAGPVLPAHQQARPGRRQRRRGRPRSRRRDHRAGRGRAGRGARRRGHRRLRATRSRGRAARSRRPRRAARRAGPRRGRAAPVHPQRLPPARPAHLLHHRREGDPGVDVPGRVEAPQCAGVIHTDFERGFIRAEVIHWDELLEVGSWSKARDVGPTASRGQGLRGRRRRRARDPLQRVRRRCRGW